MASQWWGRLLWRHNEGGVNNCTNPVVSYVHPWTCPYIAVRLINNYDSVFIFMCHCDGACCCRQYTQSTPAATVTDCHVKYTSLRCAVVLPSSPAEYFPQVIPEVLIHKAVDYWIGDVICKVHVEYESCCIHIIMAILGTAFAIKIGFLEIRNGIDFLLFSTDSHICLKSWETWRKKRSAITCLLRMRSSMTSLSEVIQG